MKEGMTASQVNTRNGGRPMNFELTKLTKAEVEWVLAMQKENRTARRTINLITAYRENPNDPGLKLLLEDELKAMRHEMATPWACEIRHDITFLNTERATRMEDLVRIMNHAASTDNQDDARTAITLAIELATEINAMPTAPGDGEWEEDE